MSRGTEERKAAVAVRMPIQTRRFPWVWFVCALLAVKALFLAIDFHVFPFLGDSMSYLETARSGWIPPDRSFVYGFGIRAAAAPFGSLYGVLLAQTAAGIGTAMLTALVLVRHLRAPRAIAFAIGLLVACEPLQVMFERMVMSESLGTLCFTGMLACACEVVTRGSRAAAIAAAALAVATVAFRTALLPAVGGCMLLLTPIMLLRTRANHGPVVGWMRITTVWGACSVGCFAILLAGYAWCYGQLLDRPPAVNYYDGLFALAALSPSVTAQDTDDPRIAEILSRPRMRRFHGRNVELWSPDGMANQLTLRFDGDFYRSNAAAKSIVRHMLLRDPLALARSARQTYLAFMSRAMRNELAGETGYGRQLDGKQATALSDYGVAPHSYDALTPARRLYAGSYWWFVALLHASVLFPLIAAFRSRELRLMMVMLCCTATLVILPAFALATLPVARYLHPLVPILAISAGALAPRRSTLDPSAMPPSARQTP